MPGSNRRPTACKADVITTTLDPFSRVHQSSNFSVQGCSHWAHTSVKSGRIFAYEIGKDPGFTGPCASALRLFCSTPSQTQCQHCLHPLLAGLLVAREI